MGKVGFQLAFNAKLTYNFGHCTSNEVLLYQRGTDRNRVWTIKKDGTRLKLYCNKAEIVDFDTGSSNEENCRKLWAVDFAGIRFFDGSKDGKLKDTASDYFRQYKAGKCKVGKM